MNRRKRPSHAANHERWLVSYADFITLLFAFFVVLFSSAQVDTRLLAERLTAKSQIRVEEGHAGAPLAPGSAWIAPGDYHMVVSCEHGKFVLQTHQGPQENSCRPAVDVLFRSVGDVYRSHALAVEMTGMGQDGLRGCEYIRELGGQVLAQDQESSVVWGMPGFVANAGLADKILPLDQLGVEIARRVRNGRDLSRSINPSNHLIGSEMQR
jgi:two-component system, chemotaxis family, protein-glutamate methylesterase/glutaminase